jgi:hypothetical protein
VLEELEPGCWGLGTAGTVDMAVVLVLVGDIDVDGDWEGNTSATGVVAAICTGSEPSPKVESSS